ncbi:zinc finger protein, putative [Plasmodium relictum]|uniref:Zinc finger protein, putative n=1 Tax=Plasmodium relictum TaxID=85471 RepID=A0A1J1H6Y6_PLARL|nr:zinc finger protein, putative [Plasmodium relictum]CRH00680.1 zinc finger protein, putative [Plasmodium relictum]
MNEKHNKNMSQVQSETLSLIKQQFFKTKMCPFQKNKNYCLNESNCHYAHSVDELKPMPDLRNTKLCDYIKKKIPCRNANCKFAHDIDTLKPSVHLATYKSTICSFWGKGKCFNGNKCRFAHGNEDIKTNEEIDLLESGKHSKKNKNKNSHYDLKQGTSSTNSFNTCDYSINCSLETTNVSSFDKSREILMLKKNNKDKTKAKTKLGDLDLNKDIIEDRNEIINNEITTNGFTFYDKKNSNSIKEVIDKIENMALSTFIENNDKYTKVIKYLLNENNLLKESLRKDQINMMLEQKEQDEEQEEEQKNKTSFGSSIAGTSSKMNSEDLTKYLFPDENSEKLLISSENRNANNISTHDDTTRIDENFNSIIKAIDDILISQNVCSFPSVKDSNTNYENKDIYSSKNTNDISREYENLLCNLKSFETLKNIYPNFNSFNIIDNKTNNKLEEEVLEQFFQNNNTNNEQVEKKKNCYDENFTFAKCISFPYENNQTKELEEFSQKKNFNSITFQQKEQLNQEIQNMQQRVIQLQQMKKEELNKNKDISSWQDNFVVLRNDLNIGCNSSGSNNNNNRNINNLNLIPKNTTNIIKEKNAKLNLRENTELNDNNVHLDKLLEFSSEKSDILKKIRNIISNELKNNENNNYTSRKISNFTNISNVNNSLTTKNTLFNDHLYSTTYNNMPVDIPNNNILNSSTIINNNNSDYDNNNGYMNDNNNHKLNNDLSKYKKEINNDQNIWNNNVNFNKYAYPILSHDWINNQKNNDFFNISKSINLSSLN